MQILILKKQQNDFQKDFFKLINNSVFGKTMENVRKHRDIKLVTPEKKKKLFGSSYHTTKLLTEQLLAAKMKRKTQTNIYKPVYLGLKTVMNEFWYDYVKLEYKEKAKQCFMDTDSFIVYRRGNDIYKNNAEVV